MASAGRLRSAGEVPNARSAEHAEVQLVHSFIEGSSLGEVWDIPGPPFPHLGNRQCCQAVASPFAGDRPAKTKETETRPNMR